MASTSGFIPPKTHTTLSSKSDDQSSGWISTSKSSGSSGSGNYGSGGAISTQGKRSSPEYIGQFQPLRNQTSLQEKDLNSPENSIDNENPISGGVETSEKDLNYSDQLKNKENSQNKPKYSVPELDDVDFPLSDFDEVPFVNTRIGVEPCAVLAKYKQWTTRLLSLVRLRMQTWRCSGTRRHPQNVRPQRKKAHVSKVQILKVKIMEGTTHKKNLKAHKRNMSAYPKTIKDNLIPVDGLMPR